MIRTYWTIQTKEAWDQAIEIGFLTGDEKYVWDEFKESYHWMMSQMKHSLPNYCGGYPIWVWTEKPDLRQRAHLPKGTEGVRLKVELDDSDVLISDFEAWHFVLNDCFLYFTESEHETYDQGESKITKEQSWERIFDIEGLKTLPDWNDSPVLQGVVERIPLSCVKRVDQFIAR